MILENYYWYKPSFLPERFCDQIVDFAISRQDQFAATGTVGFDRDCKKNPLTNEEINKVKQKRNSNIVWLRENWIFKEIHNYITLANKQANWNFDIDQTEDCQFTKYKLNQFYDWHYDSFEKPYEDQRIRKLSSTIQLSHPSEYSGGNLEFDLRNYDPNLRDESKHIIEIKKALPKGSLIVFPSFVWHRVKPVRSGTRYSLVCWVRGKKFK